MRSVPQTLISVGTGVVFGIPWLVVITAVVSLIGAVWLHGTRFGRHSYLVGSNAEAARRAGINVSAHLLKLYALSGLLAGFAAMLSLGRFSTTTLEGHFSGLRRPSGVVIWFPPSRLCVPLAQEPPSLHAQVLAAGAGSTYALMRVLRDLRVEKASGTHA